MANELELAEIKAKEILRLAEERARGMIEGAKLPTDMPSNSILELKLTYIQNDLKEIKNDVKEMKADYVTRREFDNALKRIEEVTDEKIVIINESIKPLRQFVYSLVAIFGVAVIGAILRQVIKQ